MSKRPPFFIVGANRSGTTLLRLMLGAHANLTVPEELIYFRHSMAGVSPRAWRTANLKMTAYESFVREWLTRRGEHLGFSAEENEVLADQILSDHNRNLRRPYQMVLDTWAQRQGKERWGEKTPSNLFYVDVLDDMFPGALFIQIVRDPRAGVHSMLRMPRFGKDPVICALNRRRYDVDGGIHLRAYIPKERRITIRYEDLVAEPEQIARALCSFLGEPFDPAMLEYHHDAPSRMASDAAGSYNALATKPVRSVRADAWQDEMAMRDQAVVDAVSRPVLKAYRYAPTGYRLQAADIWRVGAHVLYWRLKRWQHRDIPEYIVRYRLFEGVGRRVHAARTLLRSTISLVL